MSDHLPSWQLASSSPLLEGGCLPPGALPPLTAVCRRKSIKRSSSAWLSLQKRRHHLSWPSQALWVPTDSRSIAGLRASVSKSALERRGRAGWALLPQNRLAVAGPPKKGGSLRLRGMEGASEEAASGSCAHSLMPQCLQQRQPKVNKP